MNSEDPAEYQTPPMEATGYLDQDRQSFDEWQLARLTDPQAQVVVDCGWCHRRLNYIPPDTCVLPVIGGDWLSGTGTCRRPECQERTWRNILLRAMGPKLYPGVPLLVIRQAPELIGQYLRHDAGK